ncbi:Uncharacterised protein [Bordetella pertussis]|nr:Uncharacterised protein [Bordetella pertussis]
MRNTPAVEGVAGSPTAPRSGSTTCTRALSTPSICDRVSANS